MGLVPMKDLLDHAQKGSFTVAAFNFFNFDMLYAILEAAEAEQSPVILQISMKAHGFMRNFHQFVAMSKEYCEGYSIPVALNHDHCLTVQDAAAMVDAGFGSVMFDGSRLPFADNIAQTKSIVQYAHAHGASVEAELGKIPGFEDDAFSGNAEYTNPVMALQFTKETNCDFLVVSAGTAHGGVAGTSHLPLSFDRLRQIHEAIPTVPLVLHGAASMPEELITRINRWGGLVPDMRICSENDIGRCGRYGVCKANMDVDNYLAYTAEVRRVLRTQPELYHPMSYLLPARDAFCDEVRHKIRNVTKTSGKVPKR